MCGSVCLSVSVCLCVCVCGARVSSPLGTGAGAGAGKSAAGKSAAGKSAAGGANASGQGGADSDAIREQKRKEVEAKVRSLPTVNPATHARAQPHTVTQGHTGSHAQSQSQSHTHTRARARAHRAKHTSSLSHIAQLTRVWFSGSRGDQTSGVGGGEEEEIRRRRRRIHEAHSCTPEVKE